MAQSNGCLKKLVTLPCGIGCVFDFFEDVLYGGLGGSMENVLWFYGSMACFVVEGD